MFTKFLRPWRKVAIAAIVSAAGIATVSTAMAGECPADKIVALPNLGNRVARD